MKNLFSAVLCLLISVLWQGASAQQWIIDGKQTQVLKLEVSDPQAVYTDGSRQMTAPITFTHSLSQTSGVLQVYGKDNECHIDYFKELGPQDGLQFASSHCACLFFGQSFNDGLLIGPSYISQTEYGFGLDFEAGNLDGSWQISGNPSTTSGIVNKGYADGRYLLRTTGITTNRVIQAGNTLVISNGLITTIIP